MKISKKGIEDIVNRLYIIEEQGEKVINPKLMDELLGIIEGRYTDAGYNIISGVGVEILEIYKITKNGIKTIYRCKVGRENSIYQEQGTKRVQSIFNIHKNEIVFILKQAVDKYGYDFLKDRKIATAYCNDLLLDYPEEKSILSMLFKEGLSDLLQEIPVKNEVERKRIMLHVSKFVEKMGMRKDVQEFVGELISQVSLIDKKELSSIETCGIVYFISNSILANNQPEIFEMRVFKYNGLGRYDCKNLKQYINGMNSFIDAVKSFFLENQNMNPRQYDYEFEINCLSEQTLPRQFKIATYVCLHSVLTGKMLLQDTVILAIDTITDYKSQIPENLQEVFALCSQYNIKNLFLPVVAAPALSTVTVENLSAVRLYFYGSITDLFEKVFA